MKLSAAARTPPMFTDKPSQLDLKLGFWLEQQRKAASKPIRPRVGCRREDETGPLQDSEAAKIEVTIPMKLVNPLNGSQGTSRKAMFGASARKKKQREQARCIVAQALPKGWVEQGVKILLVRISPRPFDDDNLAAAFKCVRDGVADALGFRDDSDPRLDWFYKQETGRRMNKKKGILAQHEVRVVISIRR